MFGVAGRAASVAHEGGEFGQERSRTVNRGTVKIEVGMDLLERGCGALGGRDRIARGLRGLILIGEQQRAPRFDQMPLG